MNPKPLNPKQRRFCQEYAISLNGAQAAVNAGYAPTHAKVTASRMLTYANVRECVDQLIAECRKRLDISLDGLTELFVEDRKLAHTNRQAGAAVSATEKIAKIHGYLKEHVQVDVRVTAAQMSDAELPARLAEMDREWVCLSGREGIEERIAHDKELLVRFDRGEFDSILPPQFARAPKSPPLVALSASEFRTVSPEK